MNSISCFKSQRGDRGAALIELALTFALLFGVITLLVDLGWGMRRANVLLEASRAGARNGAFQAREDPWEFWNNEGGVAPIVLERCSDLPNTQFAQQGVEEAVRGACSYLEQEGGFSAADWAVVVSAQRRDDSSDLSRLFSAPGLNVVVRPATTASVRGCLLCFGELGEVTTQGQSTFMAVRVRDGP